MRKDESISKRSAWGSIFNRNQRAAPLPPRPPSTVTKSSKPSDHQRWFVRGVRTPPNYKPVTRGGSGDTVSGILYYPASYRQPSDAPVAEKMIFRSHESKPAGYKSSGITYYLYEEKKATGVGNSVF